MKLCLRRHMTAVCAVALWCAPLGITAAWTQPRHIAILTDDLDTLGTYGQGIRLGAIEAERAATLLGHQFSLVTTGPATARVAPEATSSGEVPSVAMRGDATAACVFLTESPDDLRAASEHLAAEQDVAVTDWHPEFRRYGAAELNERFERAFKIGMTSEAWHGWVAVKAVLEAALRDEDVCTGLSRLRFDGHKGRPLRFDPKTRRLRHPALAVRKVGEKNVIEPVP